MPHRQRYVPVRRPPRFDLAWVTLGEDHVLATRTERSVLCSFEDAARWVFERAANASGHPFVVFMHGVGHVREMRSSLQIANPRALLSTIARADSLELDALIELVGLDLALHALEFAAIHERHHALFDASDIRIVSLVSQVRRERARSTRVIRRLSRVHGVAFDPVELRSGPLALTPRAHREAFIEQVSDDDLRSALHRPIIVASDASRGAFGPAHYAWVDSLGHFHAQAMTRRDSVEAAEFKAIKHAVSAHCEKSAPYRLIVMSDSMKALERARDWAAAMKYPTRIEFRHVTAHRGNLLNETADRLAVTSRRASEAGLSRSRTKALLHQRVEPVRQALAAGYRSRLDSLQIDADRLELVAP